MGNSPTVSAEFLLHGSIYALEQCGLLLRDAVSLYCNGSYGTAIALAAFAREESGRSRILLDLWCKAIDGRAVTVDKIKKRCAKHVEKQRWGIGGIATRGNRDAGPGKLLGIMSRSHPQSEEWKKAYEELERIAETQRKRAPKDRHEQRMQGLYVDPNELGTEWCLPKNIGKEQANNFLQDTMNDYAVAMQRLEPALKVVDDSRFYEALANWTECPTLPTPPWLHQIEQG
jgi:AbiV family abortive infection protein